MPTSIQPKTEPIPICQNPPDTEVGMYNPDQISPPPPESSATTRPLCWATLHCLPPPADCYEVALAYPSYNGGKLWRSMPCYGLKWFHELELSKLPYRSSVSSSLASLAVAEGTLGWRGMETSHVFTATMVCHTARSPLSGCPL